MIGWLARNMEDMLHDGERRRSCLLPLSAVLGPLQRSVPLPVTVTLALHLNSPVGQHSCPRNVLSFGCKELLDCPVLASLGEIIAVEPAQMIR